MTATKNSFLVGLLAFLCLSLSSANRVLKNNEAENELSDNVSSGQDNQLQDSSHAALKSIPKFSSVGPTNGDCCNYGNNCGGYSYPPNYGCGGNSGCQSCYTFSVCPWHGCQGYQGCQGGQGCQGSHPPCDCEVGMSNDSKVQHESIPMGEPETPIVTIVPPVHSENHNIKSSGGANQAMKSNGGLV